MAGASTIRLNVKPQRRGWGSTFGAGEETLTLDLFLGKEAL
jgi:hypothetical protein